MKLKYISIAMLAGIFMLSSCNKKNKKPDDTKTTITESETNTGTPTTTTTPEESNTGIDSEVAINNFIEKLDNYNYKIESDFVNIKVYSESLIYFEYKNDKEVYMTVNEDETFKGYLNDGVLQKDSISFFDEGLASDILSESLPNAWAYYTGNIWDILTNSVDNPLYYTFVNDSLIKNQIGAKFLGFGQTKIGGIREITLELDKETPETAKITVTYIDASQLNPKEEKAQVLITLDYDRPKSLPTDSWVDDDERVYPSAPKNWTDTDITALTAIFDAGYGIADIIPFPSFATYSNKVYTDDVFTTGILTIRDKNATESAVDDYAQKLISVYGYELETEKFIDGSTREAYHKQIKDFGDGFYAYASIYVGYDTTGATIEIKKYYNYKEYDGFTALNNLITNVGFPSLLAYDDSTVKAYDHTYEYIESWANLFTYDLVCETSIKLNTEVDAAEYFDQYVALLKGVGYSYNEETKTLKYSCEAYENTLIFNIDAANNEIRAQFKSEKFITMSQLSEKFKSIGFPELNLSNSDSKAKSITGLYKVLYGQEHKNVYLVNMSFETIEDKIEFLDDYVSVIGDSGFEAVSPEYARVPHKEYAYYNATKKLILCFNFQQGSNNISLHFIQAANDFEPYAC